MKNWKTLIKFIKKHRIDNQLPVFKILSTSSEIIIVAEDKTKGIDETIRLTYK